ncbi:uncharacterized protein LOC141850355 [Brevipalpus obovatus]|uniref:uncharacterized protein LOC141850355 n=1 Tax=Brevipalpus obovatus TaxID=246614 RepID=UPI003D9DE21A
MYNANVNVQNNSGTKHRQHKNRRHHPKDELKPNTPRFIPHSNGSIPSKKSPLKTDGLGVQFAGREIQLSPQSLDIDHHETRIDIGELQQRRRSESPVSSVLPSTNVTKLQIESDCIDSETNSASQKSAAAKMTVFTLLKRNGLMKVEPIVDNPTSSSHSFGPSQNHITKRVDQVKPKSKSKISKSSSPNDHNNNHKDLNDCSIVSSDSGHTGLSSYQSARISRSDAKDDGKSEISSPLHPSNPSTAASDEISAPSPDWATKLFSYYDRRYSATVGMRNSLAGINPQYGHGNYSRASSISQTSTLLPDSHHNGTEPKLTDLRKILNPEEERRDFDTVFKAHWESLMDCRCFECSFDNLAKLVTVMVLGVTLFLIIKGFMSNRGR